MSPNTPQLGQELLNVPFPQMVLLLGSAIAEAQHNLDMNSIKMTQIMSGSSWIDTDADDKEVVREGVKVMFGGKMLSLLELGFTPTFYQFVDTIIEVKVSISIQSESSQSRRSSSFSARAGGKVGFFSASASVSASSVSASYASKNSYSAEGSSLLRTKLVPIPAPAILEQRIRKLMEDRQGTELTLSPDLIEMSPQDKDKKFDAKDADGKGLADGVTLKWSSSDTAIATVTEKTGVVKGVSAGIATISVESSSGLKGQAKVSVKAV